MTDYRRDHHHATHHPRTAPSSIKMALFITGTLLVAELIGAFYTNSLALLADAGHMLTDVCALALSFFAIWFSSRPATPRKTYGFYRVEILAALLNGVVLVLVALYIFYEAYGRVFDPPQVRAGWMLVVASAGLTANLASAYLLFGEQKVSMNVRGAFFHVLGDAIGSIGVIAASLLILLFGWSLADPLVSAIVAVLILYSSWILIRDAVDVLLEGTPSDINIVSVRDQLNQVPGVDSVHDLHVWTLTSGVVAMSCHVVVDGAESDRNQVLDQVSTVAHHRFRISHTTIQIEDHIRREALEACSCDLGGWS